MIDDLLDLIACAIATGFLIGGIWMMTEAMTPKAATGFTSHHTMLAEDR